MKAQIKKSTSVKQRDGDYEELKQELLPLSVGQVCPQLQLQALSMKKVEKSNEFPTWEKPMVKSVRKYKLEQKSSRTVYCINMPLPVQRLVEVSSAVHEIESIVEFYICDEDC